MYCRRNDKWEECGDEGEMGYTIVDDPDVPVNVSTDENFTSLSPGESWSHQQMLKGQNWGMFPDLDDAKGGERFRYVFKGTHIDWWDWGTEEEHKNTVVNLPCWIAGSVVDPADNGGRPKLVVPGSDPVEFVMV